MGEFGSRYVATELVQCACSLHAVIFVLYVLVCMVDSKKAEARIMVDDKKVGDERSLQFSSNSYI